jgi:hypothetical protein
VGCVGICESGSSLRYFVVFWCPLGSWNEKVQKGIAWDLGVVSLVLIGSQIQLGACNEVISQHEFV